jgi:DNA-binding transcriptional MerR regulator
MFTIDELAREAGTRTSTVRLYQTKGLLPPPEIRGRVGWYGPSHLARLRVIERLQARGFSLAAIRELLENWARGATLASVLDPHDELGTELTAGDFAALFPGGEIDPDVAARAVALGLVSYEAGTEMFRAPSRAFLEIGRELAAHGVSPARSIDEFERLAADTRRIAERFVNLFGEYVIGSAVDTTSMPATIARFRGLAARAVQELLDAALDDLVAALLAESSPQASPEPRR